jgi:hypothetical protein
MPRQFALQKAPKRICRRETTIRGLHRQQPIGVDDLEAHGTLPSRRLNHARDEEARKVVGYDDTGPLGKMADESAARCRHGFDVRVVGGLVRERGGVGLHALDDESMETVARPKVVGPKRLENH